MTFRKFVFPFTMAAILAGCSSETEFNPIGESALKSSDSQTDEGDEGLSSSSFRKSSSSEEKPSGNEDLLVVSTYDDLWVCSRSRDGLEAYVEDEGTYYVCDDGDWMIRWRSEWDAKSSSSAGDVNPDSMASHILDSIMAAFSYSSSSVLIMPGLSSSSVFMPGVSSSSGNVPGVSSSSYTPIIIGPTLLSHHGIMSWEGAYGEYSVDTGLDNGTETAGYWYVYDDSMDGGKSRIEWLVPPGNEYSEFAMDPIIDACGGVCGKFILDAGSLEYKPFVGVAFNVAGYVDASSESVDVADASAWGGLCITYTVDVDAVLELSMGETMDSALVSFDIPFTRLPKSATGNEVCKTWDQFNQAGWGRGKISGDEIAKTLGAVRFKIQASDSTVGNFNIMAIGSYN